MEDQCGAEWERLTTCAPVSSAQAGCERILTTPLPFAYTLLMARIMSPADVGVVEGGGLRVDQAQSPVNAEFAGFGAGRSALQTVTTFQVADRDTPAMSFSSTTKSSRKPGLMLPGAVAAATGDASRFLIGGGVNLLIPSRAGIPHEADRSAKLIVKQTRELYRASGWTWPQDIKART